MQPWCMIRMMPNDAHATAMLDTMVLHYHQLHEEVQHLFLDMDLASKSRFFGGSGFGGAMVFRLEISYLKQNFANIELCQISANHWNVDGHIFHEESECYLCQYFWSSRSLDALRKKELKLELENVHNGWMWMYEWMLNVAPGWRRHAKKPHWCIMWRIVQWRTSY